MFLNQKKSSAHKVYIYLIKNAVNSNIVKFYYILKELLSILIHLKIQFMPVMAKLNYLYSATEIYICWCVQI